MALKIVVGIDVGKNGAMVAICNGWIKPVQCQVTPLIKGTAEIDVVKLVEYFEEIIGEGAQVVIVIEDVHSIFGTSAKSNFQFGRSLGIIEGVTYGKGFSIVKVAPKKWQEVAFQGVPKIWKKEPSGNGRGSLNTKAMALIAAKRLYPNVDLRKSNRAEIAHDGIVDALLMAHYARIKNY